MYTICIESSHRRGLGHLFRSLILANTLRNSGNQVKFIMNKHNYSNKKIKDCGFELSTIDFRSNYWEDKYLESNKDVSTWINDRLETSYSHSKIIKENDLKLITFDDTGEGAIKADLNVASLIFKPKSDIKGKIVLQGHKYLIMDPQINKFRKLRSNLEKVLVSIGGSDTWGITLIVMKKLIKYNIKATVVLGPSFTHFGEVQKIYQAAPKGFFKMYSRGVPSLIKEMDLHQIAITSAGTTPFQANALGLPCLVIASESFEIPVAKHLQNLKANFHIGYRDDIDLSILQSKLPINQLSKNALKNVDSLGVNRVCKFI